MEEKIQCDEARLQEYYCSTKSFFFKKILRDLKRYGLLAMLLVGMPPLFLGVAGWSIGIAFIWLLLVYYLVQWLHVTIAKDKLRRNAAWGATTVKIGKNSILYSNARGISLSYYLPYYTSLMSLGSRYFLRNKRGAEEILMPTGIAPETVEQVGKMMEAQTAREVILPNSEYVYKGNRSPVMTRQGILSYLTPWSAGVYVILIWLSCICYYGFEIIGVHIPDIMVYPIAFLVTYALLIGWMAALDARKVTLTYAFRQRAVVIRSSDGWVAVVPYAQADTLYLGKKHHMLETAGGQIFPFPKAYPEEKLKSLKIKKMKSGNIASTLIFIFTLYVLKTVFALILATQMLYRGI